MRAYVFPTDGEWADFLAARPLTDVNFWLPSPVAFRALSTGDRFLFKSKAKDGNQLIGGGLFDGYTQLRVSEAWAYYGEGNGSPSVEHLRDAINHYRAKNKQPPEPDPTIGCILLRDAFFVEFAFSDLLLRAGVPHTRPDSDIASFVHGPTMGGPQLVPRRIGQQAFKSLVLTSYHRRCAITGARVTPTLQAAHIRPVSQEGQHRVDNGLLLRSDVHTLFDAGYLGVDERHRLHVSPRLREEFGNGAEFYSRAGTVIDLPDKKIDRPSTDAVTWHMDTVFRAS